jgi:hypothetical protein
MRTSASPLVLAVALAFPAAHAEEPSTLGTVSVTAKGYAADDLETPLSTTSLDRDRAVATQCAEPRRSLARRTGPGRRQRWRAGSEPRHSRPEKGKRGFAGRRHARELGPAAGRDCLVHDPGARRPGRSGQGPDLGALRHGRIGRRNQPALAAGQLRARSRRRSNGGLRQRHQRPARQRARQGGPGRPRADGRRVRGPHWRLQLAQRQGGPHRLRQRRADRAVPLSHRCRPAVARLGAAAGGHRRLVSGFEEGPPGGAGRGRQHHRAFAATGTPTPRGRLQPQGLRGHAA